MIPKKRTIERKQKGAPDAFVGAQRSKIMMAVGNYDENTMEDARSLWLDIQDSLDPLMKRKFFDYSTEKKMECSCCESLGKWERVSTDTVLQVQVKPEHEMDADEAKQHLNKTKQL